MTRTVLTAVFLLFVSRITLAADLAEIRKQAEQGDAWSQTELALRYHEGKELKQNYSEAARWYQLAANQGFSKAQANLGVLYAEGLGVQQDHKLAADWFLKAAEQGSPMAQHNLGLLYSRGHGVEKDSVEACIWESLAANSGHREASRNRDICKNRLSDDQLRAAQRRESFLYLKIEQYKSRR